MFNGIIIRKIINIILHIKHRIDFLIAIYVILSIITAAKGDMCGKPGKPLKASYTPSKDNYNVNEEVIYKCDQSYLIGPSKRTCLSNGTWSDFVPLCDNNLAHKRVVRGLENDCNPVSLVDNDKNTFCNIESGTTLTLNIANKIIKSIILNVNAYTEPHFKVRANKRTCKTMQNYYYKHANLLAVICPMPIATTNVKITFDSEVTVYDISVHDDDEENCEDPDVPCNGKFKDGEFSCDKDYSLRGNPIAHCVNRLWFPSGQHCVYQNASNHWIGCGRPGKPSNGYWFVEGNEDNRVTYACDPGYHMLGDSIRVCKNNKTWSSSIPKCVKNLATGKKTYHQPSVTNQGSSTDGFLQSCEYQDTQFYGSVDLKEPTYFNHVILHMKTNFPTDIYIYASNTSKINSLESICNYKDVVFKQSLLCNRPTVARFVVMYYSHQVSICEITVFNSMDILQCGEPDHPINGRITSKTSNSTIITTYECNDGFIIQGPQSTRCVNGEWERGPTLCISNSTLPAPTISTLIIIGIALGASSFLIAIIVGFYLIKKYCCNGIGNDKTLYPSLGTSITEISEQSSESYDADSSVLYDEVREPNYFPQMYTNKNKDETTPSEIEPEYLNVRETKGTNEEEDIYENSAAIKIVPSQAFPFKRLKNQAKIQPAPPTLPRSWNNTYKY